MTDPSTAPVAVAREPEREPEREHGREHGREHRGDIQGMRALAVGLVVLAHAGWDKVPGGYIGVDVFFVISGFLITGILGKGLREQGRIPFGDFYARRALRILPISSVVLVAICIGSAFVYTSGRLNQVLGDTAWAALFGLNLHYANAGTGYFESDSFVSPVQHYWSLAVEEQFYLFWPLIVAGGVALARAVMLRRLGPVADTRIRVVGLRYAGLAVALLCLVSLAWSWHRTGAAPQSAYFSTLTRAFELGAGAFLALIAPAVRTWSSRLKGVLSWVGLAAIIAAAVLYDPATEFPGVAAVLPVLGAAFLVAGGIEGPAYGAALLLDRAPLRALGDISFSFYLWHWPALILPAAYLGRDLRADETAAAVAVAFTLAALSYRYVEQPFRAPRVHQGYRLRALVLWPLTVSLVLGSAGVVRAQQEWREDRADTYVRPDIDPEPAVRQDSADDLVNDVGFAGELARAKYPLPDGLVPALEELRGDITLASGYQNDDMACFAGARQTMSKVCRTGAKDGRKTVVALGDSHMGMWLAPITRLAAERSYTVIPLLKQRCLPFAVLQYDPTLRRPYDECRAHGRWTVRQIRRLEPDLIVISGLFQSRLVDPATREVIDAEKDAPAFAQGARASLRELRKLAPRVLVLGPTPILPTPAPTCLGTQRATSATCAVSVRSRGLEARERLVGRLAREAKVGYLDLLPWLCDARGTCPLVVRNLIVYRDDNHVTETYAEHLLPVFEKALRFD